MPPAVANALVEVSSDEELSDDDEDRGVEYEDGQAPKRPPRNIVAPPEIHVSLTDEEEQRIRDNAPRTKPNGQRLSFYAREAEIKKMIRRKLRDRYQELYANVPVSRAPAEQPYNRAGDKRGGRHARIAQWHPDEDAVLVQCVPLSNDLNRQRPNWKETARRIAEAASAHGMGEVDVVMRTPKSVRCRWMRLRDGRVRSERTGGEPPAGTRWSKCSVCNQYKAGHICPGPLKTIEDIARERFDKDARAEQRRLLKGPPVRDAESSDDELQD